MRYRLAALSGGVSLAMTATAQRALAACDIGGGVSAGADCAQGNLSQTSLTKQVGTITNILIYAIGIIAVIMVVIGGLRYVVSGGDPKGTASAKDTIMYAVIGVVVALLAYSLVNFVIGRVP